MPAGIIRRVRQELGKIEDKEPSFQFYALFNSISWRIDNVHYTIFNLS